MKSRTPLQFSTLIITGERVQLVPISEQYSDIIFEEFTDEITRLMIPATPTSSEQIVDFIRTSKQGMADNVELTFVILDRQSKEFLGVCALHGNLHLNEPVLGIWLKKGAHGNHYGREAIKILVNWARENLIFDFMVYPCDRDNIPSRKIAEHLNGQIFRSGEVKSMSGRILNEIAYKIV